MKGTLGLKKGSVPFKNDLETTLGTWYMRTYPYTLARTYVCILVHTYCYVHINMYMHFHAYVLERTYIRMYTYIRICLYIPNYSQNFAHTYGICTVEPH